MFSINSTYLDGCDERHVRTHLAPAVKEVRGLRRCEYERLLGGGCHAGYARLAEERIGGAVDADGGVPFEDLPRRSDWQTLLIINGVYVWLTLPRGS